MITANARGTLITLAALHGQSFESLSDFMKQMGLEFADHVEDEPEHTARKLSDAHERYVFL